MTRESTPTIEQPKDKAKERIILEKRAKEQIKLISDMARESRLHDYYNMLRAKGEKMAVKADAEIFNKRGESKRGVDSDAANLWANQVTNKLESFLDRKEKNKSYIKEIELINKAIQESRLNDYYLEQKSAGDAVAVEADTKVFGTGDRKRGKGNDAANQWANEKVKKLEEMIAGSVSEKEIKELLDVLDGNNLVDSEVSAETPTKPVDVAEAKETKPSTVRVHLVETGVKEEGSEGGPRRKSTILGDPQPESGVASAPRAEQSNSEFLTKLETEKDPAKRIALWLELAKEQKKKGQGDFEDSLVKAEKELSKIDDINKKLNLLVNIIDVRISLGADEVETGKLLDEAGKQLDKLTDTDLKTVIRHNLIILNGKMTNEGAEITALVDKLKKVQGDLKAVKNDRDTTGEKNYPMIHVKKPESGAITTGDNGDLEKYRKIILEQPRTVFDEQLSEFANRKNSESDEIVELSEDELMTSEKLADALLDYFWDYIKENPDAGFVPLKSFVDVNKLGAKDIQEIIDNLNKRGYPVQGGYPIQMGDPTMGRINIGEPVLKRIISAENDEAKKIGDNEASAYRLLALATNRILVAKGRPSESLDSGVRFALDQAWQVVQDLNKDDKNFDLVDRLREEIAVYWQEYGDNGKYLEVMSWDSGRSKKTDSFEAPSLPDNTIDLLDESGYERLVQQYHEAYPDEDEEVLKSFVQSQLDKGVTTIKAPDLKHLKELADIYTYEYGINLKTDAYRGLISAFNENFPDATPIELVTIERALEALPDDPKQLEAARSTFLSVLEAKKRKGVQDFEQFTRDLSQAFSGLSEAGKRINDMIEYGKRLDKDAEVQTMLNDIKTWSIDQLESELAKYGNATVINSPERNALSIEESVRLSFIQDELRRKTDEVSVGSLRTTEAETQQEFADMTTDRLVSELIRYGRIGGFDPFNVRKMSTILLNNADRPRFDYIRSELLKRPANEVAKARLELIGKNRTSRGATERVLRDWDATKDRPDYVDDFEPNLDEDAYHELIKSFHDRFPDATPAELATVEHVLEGLPNDPKQLEATRLAFMSVLGAKGDKDGQAEEKSRLLLEDSLKGTGSKPDELVEEQLQQKRFDEFTRDLSKAFAELGNIDFKIKPSAIPDISNAYHELAGLEFDSDELNALQSDLDTRGIDYSSLLKEDKKGLDSDKVVDAVTLAAGLGVGVSVDALKNIPVAIRKGWLAKGLDFILGRNKKNKRPEIVLKTGAQEDLDVGFEDDEATESTEPGRTIPFALQEDEEPLPLEKLKKGLAVEGGEAEIDGKISSRMSNQEKEAGNAKDPEKRTQAFLKLANVRVADYEAGHDVINLVGARSVLNKAELSARQVKNPKIRKGLIDDIVVYWQRLGDNDTAGKVRAGK
ncbi:MAG: hypothetical protein WA057_05825 [Candidatus Magasanikiibacteriota bacterium]